MKKVFLIAASFMLLFPISISAQISLGSIKQKAGEALGNAIDRKIEQELNKAADRVVNKYWDRVIGKYYAGLYEDADGNQVFPFILSDSVNLEPSYHFNKIVKIKVDTYKKNGKLDETMFMNTHTNGDANYMGTAIEDEESEKKDQTIFIINDFKNEAFVLLMESEGEKSRMAYSLVLNEQAVQEMAAEMETEPVEEVPTAEELGTKTILGYSCQGYGYTSDDDYTEIWVTDEDVFGMNNAFGMNMQSGQQRNVNLPANYPQGSVMEISNTDAKTKEKVVMQVVDIQENASVTYSMDDYPAIGTVKAEE